MAVTLCYVRSCEQQHDMRHSGFWQCPERASIWRRM